MAKARTKRQAVKAAEPLSFSEASKVIERLPERTFAMARTHLESCYAVAQTIERCGPDSVDGGRAGVVRAFMRDFELVHKEAEHAYAAVEPNAAQLRLVAARVGVPAIGDIVGEHAHDVCCRFWGRFALEIFGWSDISGWSVEGLTPFLVQISHALATVTDRWCNRQTDIQRVLLQLQNERQAVLSPPVTDADYQFRSAQDIAQVLPESKRQAFVRNLQRDRERLPAGCWRERPMDDLSSGKAQYEYLSAFPAVRQLMARYLPD